MLRTPYTQSSLLSIILLAMSFGVVFLLANSGYHAKSKFRWLAITSRPLLEFLKVMKIELVRTESIPGTNK